MPSREDLLAEIAREESRLVDLRAEVETAAARLAGLREQLASLPVVQVPLQPRLIADVAIAPATNAAKVDLFRSLFRGRNDVFPRRWENEKKGKSGYSPACDNEWEWGLCEKKRTPGAGKRATCGECSNQAFIAVSDEEVAKHLRGDQVMGVYPLLADETCWFLAADFDKKTWQEDIAAFAETCNLHDVPVAIERSRSGNGAHAWFFFASPVSAVAARKLGCFLITETMARRHQLSMESYDRLFPNQDTMPKGGFGNLIALPLQREARDAGNSVFVNESFNPWPDQWAFLAGVKRIDATLVHALAEEASRRGQVIGVRISEYQYYEFQAIDRPLTAKEMSELRSYSTRAQITLTSFVNEYSFGSFKGDEDAWMEKYFDAYLYLANWGTHVLKLRLPSRLLDAATAKTYCGGDSAFVREKAGKVVLSFVSQDEEGGDWVEGEGQLSSMISVRAELARGDLRALYLGWLLRAQTGELDDDDTEPPVPPGLGKLSASLESLAEFLRIDGDLHARWPSVTGFLGATPKAARACTRPRPPCVHLWLST